MHEHCENCGAETTGSEGYTACCNERVCDGQGSQPFNAAEAIGQPDIDTVSACCSARAEKIAKTLDLVITSGAW